MATKANNNVNVFDTVNNKVKTQTIGNETYLVGKQKADGIHLVEDDGKGLVGCYESVGSNIIVERPIAQPQPQRAQKNRPSVSGMTADDKLAALNSKGKADGFVKMSNAAGEGSIWKMNGGAPVPVDDKEIEALLGVILDQDYIHNMRIDRSWILPQMKQMLFDENGNIDTKQYRTQVKERGINDAWDLLVHNLGKMCYIKNRDPKEFELMACNWNRELAVAMAKNDLQNAKDYVAALPTHTCSKFYPSHLPYVKIFAMYGKGHTGKMYFTERAEEIVDSCINHGWHKKEAMKTRTEQKFLTDLWYAFDERLLNIRCANTIEKLYDAVKEYAEYRIKYPMEYSIRETRRVWTGKKYIEQKYDKVVFVAKFPEQYISAFKADGAYYTMRTLLRYYGEKIGKGKSFRDNWLIIIDHRMKEYAGEGYKMFGLMVNEFFPKIGLYNERFFDRLK